MKLLNLYHSKHPSFLPKKKKNTHLFPRPLIFYPSNQFGLNACKLVEVKLQELCQVLSNLCFRSSLFQFVPKSSESFSLCSQVLHCSSTNGERSRTSVNLMFNYLRRRIFGLQDLPFSMSANKNKLSWTFSVYLKHAD